MSSRKTESKVIILKQRKVFSRNFRHARKNAGITQEELTKSTGLTQAFISDVENAKSTISLDNANALADAVGQPLYKLLTPQSRTDDLKERKIFGRNFRHARKNAGITQEELTKSTGLTQAFISDVENAKSTISLDNANALADAVGQPLYKLLTPQSDTED